MTREQSDFRWVKEYRLSKIFVTKLKNVYAFLKLLPLFVTYLHCLATELKHYLAAAKDNLASALISNGESASNGLKDQMGLRM